METTAKFSVSIIGEESGDPYTGDFVVKTLLTRRDVFKADELRRIILGANPASAMDDRQAEAYIMGQLVVRIVEAPGWWKNSEGGQLLPDLNVIMGVYEAAKAKETERSDGIKKKAEEAREAISKS